MKGSAYKTRRGAYFLALSLLSIFGSDRVLGAPQPILPEMMFREDYGLEIPSQTLVDRLKQRVERKEENIEKEIAELAEEQMEIQALLDAKAISQKEQHHRQQQQQQQQLQLQQQQQQQQQQQHQQQDLSMDDFETLPVPAAVYHTGPLHSGKRTSYMALCHFKICNMGRKRQM